MIATPLINIKSIEHYLTHFLRHVTARTSLGGPGCRLQTCSRLASEWFNSTFRATNEHEDAFTPYVRWEIAILLKVVFAVNIRLSFAYVINKLYVHKMQSSYACCNYGRRMK